MQRVATDLLKALQRQYVRAEKTAQRVDALLSSRKLTEYDADQIYSGIFLSAFVTYERFIEEIFIGYLLGKVSPHKSKLKTLLVIPNREVAITILSGDRNYVDWLPFSRTRDRAATYFVGPTPFATIGSTELQMMDELSIIRNALAHKSEHAHKKFVGKVIGSTSLRPRDKVPEKYLRSVFRLNPAQTRLQHYLTQMLLVSNKLCQ